MPVGYPDADNRPHARACRLRRRGHRFGARGADDILPKTAEFLRVNPSLEFINVTGAAGSTTGSGHAYFRDSPWVSSDILTLLAYDLEPALRGLVKEPELPV